MTLLACADCQEEIPEGAQPYTMRIELFASIDDPLEISAEELETNFEAELKKIVGQLEAMSEEELELQEERVHSAFSFVLCTRCRDSLAERLRRNMTAS